MKQLSVVVLIAAVNIAITYVVFEVAGSKKVIDWSKSIGFFAFALAAWGALIAKLPDISKIDLFPEWEQLELNAALSRLKQQIWACFFFTAITGAVGVCAGVFADTKIQDETAILVLYVTLTTFSTFAFLPIFWGRITSAIRYINIREKQEKDRAAEVETLTKGLQTPFKAPDAFKGYTTEAK